MNINNIANLINSEIQNILDYTTEEIEEMRFKVAKEKSGLFVEFSDREINFLREVEL